MAGDIDHQRFIALLTERFPEVAANIDSCSRGLLHCEIAELSRATQAAIESEDKQTVKQHFEFIDEIFKDAAPDVENAVYVSYLEHLNFESYSAFSIKARELLSPRLQQALADLEAHWDRIYEWMSGRRQTS